MDSKQKHTPTPWKQHETEGKIYASIRGADNSTIADCGSRSDKQAQANAAFIVTACNAHEAIKLALYKASIMLDESTELVDGELRIAYMKIVLDANEALKLAGEEV